MIDLNQFRDWQAEKPAIRSFKIEQDKNYVNGGCRDAVIWVYDYQLRAGQFVSSVEEIDLEEAKVRDEKKTLCYLLKKYKKEEGEI